MKAEYSDVAVDARGSALHVSFSLPNQSRATWTPETLSAGWQLFDPETHRFIEEGAWTPVADDVPPGAVAKFELSIPFQPEPGAYEVYVSHIRAGESWAYAHGEPFLRIVVDVADDGALHILAHEMVTQGALRRRRAWAALPRLFASPLKTIAENHRLIRSMARRDILARYRGSFGDVFWTILNPLLLMATYFFVFGIVLQARYGNDQSRTGFALYFLAGMLPWLAFSEPVGRAASVILEHRNFVKKFVFPLDTLPVNHVVSGFVTELFGAGVFVAALLVIRHTIPATVLWLPVLVLPQLLFTLGLCWFLAALGVYMRDLGQIMALVLTIWFFITPICYPESQNLLPSIAAVMRQNPLYILVRLYREVFLEARAPELIPLVKLWAIALALFFLGHIWFYRLRKSFADVI
ncbi:MAG TPA: ABC transporter permease [Bryobacteraceae bacterium]|nr:ABC transporter permease [Bryobacteraceae bacterium]